MSFNRPGWANLIRQPVTIPDFVLAPSAISLNEPVVAEGAIVFAADENGDVDIVVSVYETVNFTVEPV